MSDDMLLDRDTLLQQKDRIFITVPVKLQDGRTVQARLRSPTVTERANYISGMWDDAGNRGPLDMQHARLVQLSLVDGDGRLLFKPTERASLLGLFGPIIAEIYERAAELWRLGSARQEDAKKNSSETDDDETPSES